MKKFSILLCMILTVAISTMAFAAQGKVVVDPNNRPLGYHTPAAASAVCTTTTTTKGTIATVATAGYSTLHWQASDSAGAAIRIKRHLNNGTAYMPGTGDKEGLHSATASVAFKPYSGVSATYTVCYDLQSGGKTP